MYKGIYWSIFDNYPENTCYCKCVMVYRSHTKAVSDNGIIIYSRKMCPQCNKYLNNNKRIVSDTEVMINERKK